MRKTWMGDTMISRISTTPNFSLDGCLLVAAPSWRHELFGRAVCLVVHHSPDGSIGVFLNRSLSIDAAGLWKQLTGEKAAVRPTTINFGGPQSGPIVALHNRRELAEFTSAEGVYLAAQVDHLQELVTSPASEAVVKIIVGQADWKPGQLDSQFAEGKWLPLPVTSKLVFADEQNMWADAMREIGDHFVSAITGAHRPLQGILAH